MYSILLNKAPAREYESVLDIPYVKNMIHSLTILGLWPHEIMGEKQWFADYRNTKILFSLLFVAVVLAIKYLIKNIGVLSFFDLGKCYINIIMAIVCLQRVALGWSSQYKKMVEEFFTHIHLFNHKHQNDYAMKVFKDVEKISNFFTILLHIELISGVIFFALTPLYNSYSRGMFNSIRPPNATFDHGCYYDLPFDYTTNFKGYIIVFILNIHMSHQVSGSVAIVDTLISVIVFHLWGHLKILKYNLRHFPRPEMKGLADSTDSPPWYNEEESQNITRMLIESIEYYSLIKNFMSEVSTALGPTIFLYFLFHQISGCILLIEISQMNAQAFGSYGILTISLFQQLIQMSTVFELIGSQSETIKDAVYEVPWECMDAKNRKIVLIYLCNVQEPLHLKALGILPVGVQTMASILKNSVSYFMFLQTSAV